VYEEGDIPVLGNEAKHTETLQKIGNITRIIIIINNYYYIIYNHHYKLT
jgi:hypothetical protein